MTKELNIWVITDPAFNQAGRKLSTGVFEFKQDDIKQRIIDLNKFKADTIETVINSFGYTLQPKSHKRPTMLNITEWYGDYADWVKAECLFECEIKEDKQI